MIREHQVFRDQTHMPGTLLMIDDVDVADTDLRKFFDDNTMAECVERNEESKIKVVVTE